MIDINELRINDVIFNKEDNVNCCVHTIDRTMGIDSIYAIDSENVYNYPKDYYEPIPITEELLEKLGFVKEEYEIYKFYSFEKFTDKLSISINNYSNIHNGDYLVFFKDEYGGTMSRIGVKYLHQLQDVIYHVTKQELDVSNILK